MPESRTLSRPARPAPRPAVTRAILLTLVLGSLVACSAGSSPPSASPVASAAASTPASSAAPAGVVRSVQAAVAAVGAVDSNFLGYTQRNPDLIGQSAWFEGRPVGDGFEVTFFRGEGDCPAGCIERSFIKFFVSGDGRVEKRCEWQEGAAASGTPC